MEVLYVQNRQLEAKDLEWIRQLIDAHPNWNRTKLSRHIAQSWQWRNQLLRCFLWVVSELVDGWYSQFELTGSVVGGGSEVDEVSESPSHSFC